MQTFTILLDTNASENSDSSCEISCEISQILQDLEHPDSNSISQIFARARFSRLLSPCIVYKYLSSLVRTWDLFRSPLYPDLCHNRASTDISDKIQAPGEKLELPDQNLAVWRRYWSRLFVSKNFDIEFNRLKNYPLYI